MSGLDVNTPRGQQTIEQERAMVRLLKESFPSFEFVSTNKKTDADVDGIIVSKDGIVAVYESKCRTETVNTFRTTFKNEWLITFEKVMKGCAIARSLRVPFVGYLYSVPDDQTLSMKIADENGNILPAVRLERTKTQKTVNGGVVVRTNAYIDLSNSKLISRSNKCQL